MTKRVEFGCCKQKWVFEVQFPEDLKPAQRILLTYLFPYLNEKYMNIWNRGDTHNLEGLPHDRQIPEMKRGVDKILADRLVDKMSYDDISEKELPTMLNAVLSSNPSREAGHHKRVESIKDSPSLVREYARKRRIQIKKKLLDELIVKISKE